MLIVDLDETLLGERKSLKRLLALLREKRDQVGFGVATGRSIERALEGLKEWGVPLPDVVIASAGTEIYYGPNLAPDRVWEKHVDYRWDPERIAELLSPVAGLKRQAEGEQRRFKLSYLVDADSFAGLKAVRRRLSEHDVHAKLVYSQDRFLDLIPERAGQGIAVRWAADKWGVPIERVLVAGDNGNDMEMLRGRTLGIVVANHAPELEALRGLERVFFAEGACAQGVLDGLEHYDFFGRCVPPVAHDE